MIYNRYNHYILLRISRIPIWKIMKNWRILILSFILYANSIFAMPQLLDKVVAIVNDSVILESDINNLLDFIKRNAYITHQQLPEDTSIRHQILEKLIMDEIIIQLACRANITISDTQLDKAISNIATKNHMSKNQLRNRLISNNIDYNTYRTQIRKELLISEVRNSEVHGRITILPQEVDSLATQITTQNNNDYELNLSNMLISLPEIPTQEQVNAAKSLAISLIKQSRNGTDFKKLTTIYSVGPQTITTEEIGWKKTEELPTIFTARLSGAKKGMIVGPIRSGVGFHILKVNNIRGGTQPVLITEVHVYHILLRTSIVMTNQQARSKLLDIARQINSRSITFNAAAKQISEDPASANQGGDLGWNSIDTFDITLRNILMHLKKDQVSEPVQSSFGWHLIKLVNTRKIDKTDAYQKANAYRLLFDRKFNTEVQTWMQEQRASAYVKIINNT